MATTTASGLQAEIWSKAFFRYGLKNMFFSRFIGNPMRLNSIEKKPKNKMILTDANAMIQMKMDLTKAKGDDITFPLISPLTGHGQVGGALEGNEAGITNLEWKATIKQWGHAVLDSGPLMRQQAAFDWDPVSRDTLALWYAYALDAATYASLAGLYYKGDAGTALVAQRAPTRKLVCGTATGDSVFASRGTDALLEADEVFSLECISLARRTAVATEPIMRPIIIEGQPRYLMFLHPLQVKALKASSDYRTLMQSSIAERGNSKNPIFNGSIGTYDGVILYEYQRAQTRTGDGEVADDAANNFEATDVVKEDTTAARAIFAGAQATVHAYAAKPKFIQKSFDYGRNHGNAVDMLIGVGKPHFAIDTSTDYGTMVVDTAVVAD